MITKLTHDQFIEKQRIIHNMEMDIVRRKMDLYLIQQKAGKTKAFAKGMLRLIDLTDMLRFYSEFYLVVMNPLFEKNRDYRHELRLQWKQHKKECYDYDLELHKE